MVSAADKLHNASSMPPILLPADYTRIRRVNGFQELVATPFANDVNALCWERTLAGDFGEVVAQLGAGEGIVTLDETRLRALPLGAAGRIAVDVLLADLQRLRDQDRDPVLNCIHGYPRDEGSGPVATDVFSFHADSAPVEADTWLCTYYGPPSEGLRNEEAQRRVDIPEIRAELLKLHGGADDATFREFLKENCYDLHYTPVPPARPFSFGVGNLWRIACEYTGPCLPHAGQTERQRALPCIHRAPETLPGQARLLLLA